MLLLQSEAHLAPHLQALLLAEVEAVLQDLLAAQVPAEGWAGFATPGDAGDGDLRAGWFWLGLRLGLVARHGDRHPGWRG